MTTERNPGDRAAELARLGLHMTARFIPFSQSRNKAEKTPSLNWLVTVLKNGREVITTDYMQGSGHAPAYKKPVKFSSGKVDHYSTEKAIARECETGRTVGGAVAIAPPGLDDVMHSLVLDGDAINAGSFADWCAEYGYSDDSIKARETFDTCVAVGMKLRAALGDADMATLREIVEGL